jgi:N-ethylmaleimide reductase
MFRDLAFMAESAARLFESIPLGKLTLPNRLVMAPLTRARWGREGVLTDMAVEYYTQRAGVGLIIGEATHISPQGYGWVDAPGIYTDAQIAGWKKVTDAVHQKGGRMVCQLWHMGRISHPSLQPDNQLPVSSSAVAAPGEWHTYEGKQAFVTPRPLETDEISGVVAQYRQAAINAKSAGFDGVELLAAGNYLPAQFLNPGINQRTDRYGGSAENRIRFVIEVLEALVNVWGSEAVGVKISPGMALDFPPDPEPEETYGALIRAINPMGLMYLHVMEAVTMPGMDVHSTVDLAALRTAFDGPYLANGNYTRERAIEKLSAGLADAIVFGRLMIANPDLPERFRLNAELNEPDMASFYGGDEKGYTDYPCLQ